MKKKVMIYSGITSMLLASFAAVFTGCFTKRKKKAYKQSYVDRITTINGTLEVGRSQHSSGYTDSSTFYCKRVEGTLVSADALAFGIETEFAASQKRIAVFNDIHYNQEIPLDSWAEEGYYFPCELLFARIYEVRISSPNASFGEVYPPGSDLTPICTFELL